MKTNRKTKTDTPTHLTGKEHDALLMIRHAVAREERHKCGLEYIGRLLDNARGYAEAAAARILPDVADVKLNPAPTLESLCTTPADWKTTVKLSELCELVFAQLKKEIAIKPYVELLHQKFYHGETRLETFANDWFVFLFGWNGDGGCLAFMQKKHALAQALGRHEAADKLSEAFNQLTPAFKLTEWGQDAKRFAREITPDDFHVAFRNAMKLDAEATAEINGESKSAPVLELIDELKPDETKHDAREYCARVLLYVWNTGEHGGKRKSADYVFVQAKRGDNLFADIHYVRTLQKKWGLTPGGIMERAAELHATQGGGKHKKRDGLERPETMREAAKKSRADERKKMGAEGKRRGGKKR